MIRFLADENFNNTIVRTLQRRRPSIDLVRVQDVGLLGASDPDILDYVARENRVVLTHDENTMIHFAYERVRQGLAMPGLVLVSLGVSVNVAADDILLLAECSHQGEWESQVLYLPLS